MYASAVDGNKIRLDRRDEQKIKKHTSPHIQ